LDALRDEAHSLNEQDFKFICKLVYDATGIVLSEGKREMIYRRLMRRLRETRLPSFKAYCDLLRDPSANELPNFINSITTNLTSFFRENHHFEFLSKQLLPELLQESTGNQRIRIWSSACSTGEEPYSIAMTMLEALGNELGRCDAKLLATDLDTDVLHRAESGIYNSDRLENMPLQQKKQWFLKNRQDPNQFKIHNQVKSLITFKQLNLLEDWPMKGPFDMIFCRNVLIYFDRATQQNIIQRMHALLKPNGVLALGHSENIGDSSGLFKNIGRTLFRKVDSENPRSSISGRSTYVK
jgi:chemotaxis protein methyltransferase CheR